MKPQYLRHATWLVVLTIWSTVVALPRFSSRSQAQEKQAGELLTVSIPGTQVEIRFRWCPPGEVRPDDPSQDSRSVKMEGFYLSEAEITQEQFEAVLGTPCLSELTGRVQARTELPYSRYLGKDFPVFMVSPTEAVAFCMALERTLTADVFGLEVVEVRLPVHFEWQYACLAREQYEPTFAHFSDWPATWENIPVTNLDSQGETTLAKYVEQNKLLDAFRGTQEEVVAKLRTSQDAKVHKVLEVLLRTAIGLDQELGVNEFTGVMKPSYANGRPTGKLNRWQLSHMHTNVYEWTWRMADGPEQVNVAWNCLKRGDIAQLRMRDIKIGRMGGSFVTRREWASFTAWHVASESPYPADPEQDEHCAIRGQAGFRIWYRINPAPTWLVDVRRKALIGDETTLRQARERLIPKMNEADAQANRARIDFYSALAKYHSGDRQEALNAYKNAAPTMSASDPFFEEYEKTLRREVNGL